MTSDAHRFDLLINGPTFDMFFSIACPWFTWQGLPTTDLQPNDLEVNKCFEQLLVYTQNILHPSEFSDEPLCFISKSESISDQNCWWLPRVWGTNLFSGQYNRKSQPEIDSPLLMEDKGSYRVDFVLRWKIYIILAPREVNFHKFTWNLNFEACTHLLPSSKP